MVRMIYVVTTDMGYILLIFSIMVLGFANTFYIIARNGNPEFSGDSFWYSVIYAYRTGLGDFAVDDFDTNRDSVLVYLIWLLSTFLILIVLLNMLIAIISDIFEKVHENIQNNLLKELAKLMVETELLISRKRLFKNKKYLIIIEQEKGETSKVDAESKLAIMRINMNKKVQEQRIIIQDLTKGLEDFIDQEVDNKGLEMETSVRKQVSKLAEKMDTLDRIVNDCKEMAERVKISQHAI